VTAALAAFAISLFSGLNRADEAWFLLVADRVAAGDHLYRDIAFPTTPLSVWAMAGAITIFGSEIILLRALVGICVGLSALIAAVIAHDWGLSVRASAAIAAVTVVTAALPAGSLYQRVATLLTMLALAQLLRWMRDPQRARSLYIASAAAGACIGAKHSLGILVAAVLTLVLLWRFFAHGASRKMLLLANAFMGLPVLLFLLVLAVLGDLQHFYEHAVVGAGRHAQDAGYSYLEGAKRIFGEVPGDSTLQRLDGRWGALIFAVPPLGLVTLVVALMRRTPGERSELVVVGGIFLCALITLFPRADLPHLTLIAPTLIIGLAIGCYELSRSTPWLRNALATMTVLWLMLGLASTMGNPALDLARHELAVSDLQHFRGIPAKREELDTTREQIERLRITAGEYGAVLMLTSDAPFRYLTSGLRSHGPYDFPITSLLGERTDDLLQQVRSGEYGAICMRERWNEFTAPLRPRRVEDEVRGSMRLVDRLGFCDLYA